ncbi:MAG: amidohydrolase [Acidobacteriota bacterium]|nr:amidohydrolase [Acidobacteriota bacterium]
MRRFLLLFLFGCASARQPADLILTGGKVFTADPTRPWAEAVAIRGDRIVAVGSTAEIGKNAARVIELHGRVVVPGINDAHVHAPWAAFGQYVAIADNASVADVMNQILDATKRAPEGTWLRATIPPAILEDPSLTREALDAAAPRHPVYLDNFAGHQVLTNTAGLRAWKIGDNAPDPPGGWYGRKDGRLNGWVYEHALWMKAKETSEALPDAALVASMRGFAQTALRFGITSVQSMPSVSIERLMRLESQTGTPLRWRWMEVQMARVSDATRWPAKYIADGTPIERDAALREPYSDRPDQRGRMNFTDEQIRHAVEVAARSNQQLLIHAAGDVPIAKLFAAMNQVHADWPAKRVRIEHGDFISQFIPDAKRLGVIVVQNPSHFTIREIVQARYGSERMRAFMQFRSLIADGIPIAIGSDGALNPWLNVMFAATHPINPGEAITREQAVIAYTRGSAYAEFTEREKGTIANGMLADLAVLSQDIFTVPLPELPKTEAEITIVGGRIAQSK